jgi:hypothetical protein
MNLKDVDDCQQCQVEYMERSHLLDRIGIKGMCVNLYIVAY